MNDHTNKNLVCSIIFVEIVNFFQYSDEEQINVKYNLNKVVNAALKEYARSDRVLLDKGDAVVIAYMAAPADVLDIVLDMLRSIKQLSDQNHSILLTRIGVHLGTVRVVKDINEQLNVVGNGLSEAQSYAQLAKINTIVVSPAFYAVSLPLRPEIASEYVYTGFSINSPNEEYQAYYLGSITPIDSSNAKQTIHENEVNTIDELKPMPAYQPSKTGVSVMALLDWRAVLALAIILLTIWMLVKLVSKPIEPKITLTEPEVLESKQETITITGGEALIKKAPDIVKDESFSGLLPNESIEKLPEKILASQQHRQTSNVDSSANIKNIEVMAKSKSVEQKKSANAARIKRRNQIAVEDENGETAVLQGDTKIKADSTKEVEITEGSLNSNHNQDDKENTLEAKAKEKSAWEAFKDSIKNGKPRSCSQAETALGQCR